MISRTLAAWRAALALLVLNVLITLQNHWPTPWPTWTPGISLELVLAAMAMALWVGGRRSRMPGVRGLRWLAGITTFVIAAHYVDSTAAALLGRPLNVYWDAAHAWSVVRISGISLWWLPLAIAAVVLHLALLYVVARACWKGLTLALAHDRRVRVGVLLVGAALVLVFASHDVMRRDTRFAFARPTLPSLARQVELLVAAQLPGGMSLSPSPDFRRHSLAGLHGADVLLVFSESYGACTLDDDAKTQSLSPTRDRFVRQMQGSGRGVVSARLVSPTFGGASWLAHAAVLSGVDTRQPGSYEQLLASRRPTLVQYFKQQGWRTVNWMPGLQKPWPEGSFYGFDRYADAGTVGYRGIEWGYWRVPDQASMALLNAQEFAQDKPGRAPVFAVMATVASHMPFVPLPPYLADGNQALDPAAYTPGQLDEARSKPGTTREESGTGAYLDSLDYTFSWLGEYLQQRAPRDMVTIVLGDHQPWAVVSGADASWQVPVHIVSSDAALLDRLVARGFVRGMSPPASVTPMSMHELAPLLMDVFDAPEAPAAE